MGRKSACDGGEELLPGEQPNDRCARKFQLAGDRRLVQSLALLIEPLRPLGILDRSWRPTVRLPLLASLVIPAFTRSVIISRSNSANTDSIPAIARPDGVVRSSASLSEIKPMPNSVSSLSVTTRWASDRP
jgi:hypothetical protein